jgi:hypothetical protein
MGADILRNVEYMCHSTQDQLSLIILTFVVVLAHWNRANSLQQSSFRTYSSS